MLADCLAHLDAQTYRDFEIIVVDSSTDDATAEVMQSRPTAIYTRITGKNNMPQARNVGIAHARGDIVAFIDDDCMVRAQWLANLVAAYDDPAVGGSGGRILDQNRPAIQSESRVGVILPEGTVIGNFAIKTDVPRDVDYIQGGNMSFRRAILELSGGFDPWFGGDNSSEELDQCMRVRKRGHRLRFVPSAEVEHLSAPRSADVVSRNYFSPRRIYFQARNRTYLYFKNRGLEREYCIRTWYDIRGWAILAVRKHSPGAWRRLIASITGHIGGALLALARKPRD